MVLKKKKAERKRDICNFCEIEITCAAVDSLFIKGKYHIGCLRKALLDEEFKEKNRNIN